MDWKPAGASGLRLGGKKIPVKTLKVMDDSGYFRRYRIATLNESAKASSRYAQARLAKDSTGKIGALITGAHSPFFRLGRRGNPIASLFVSFNALSKQAKSKLLRQIEYELIDEEEMVLAREIKT